MNGQGLDVYSCFCKENGKDDLCSFYNEDKASI